MDFLKALLHPTPPHTTLLEVSPAAVSREPSQGSDGAEFGASRVPATPPAGEPGAAMSLGEPLANETAASTGQADSVEWARTAKPSHQRAWAQETEEPEKPLTCHLTMEQGQQASDTHLLLQLARSVAEAASPALISDLLNQIHLEAMLAEEALLCKDPAKGGFLHMCVSCAVEREGSGP